MIKLEKAAVVCFDKTFESSAMFMTDSLLEHTPLIDVELITRENINNDLSDYDFFFIWNGVDISVDNYENILKNLKPHPYNLKCSNCNNEIAEDYEAYRLKRYPCPLCGARSSRANNFIYIFAGSHLKNNADDFFISQLRTRFWSSVDANWDMFKCLVQGITIIPHIMIMPQRAWQEPKTPTISHFPTPDESKSCIALDNVKKMCNEKGYIYNEDPSKLYKTHIYLDQLYSGVPSQYAINAMSIGIPTMVNLSKFYLSHYPMFPATNITAKTLIQSIDNPSNDMENSEDRIIYVNKWFGPEKVSKQWYHLARFILSPDIMFDNYPELDRNDLPKYWAYQGGYEI